MMMVKHKCSTCQSESYLPKDTGKQFTCPVCEYGVLVMCEPDKWEKLYPNTLPNLWVWHENMWN